MSLKTAKFNPDGGKLVAEIDMKGICMASYQLKLSEHNSSQKVALWDGDNQNIEDDSYALPIPVSSNEGRILRLSCLLSPLPEGVNTAYSVQLHIIQDGKTIGTTEESGTFSGPTVSSLQFIKLVSE